MIAGTGRVPHDDGAHPIVAGYGFIFKRGEAQRVINTGTDDLVLCVVADDPMGASSHNLGSNEWVVRSPQRRLLSFEPVDYWGGEE
jgi:hypothetical protein